MKNVGRRYRTWMCVAILSFIMGGGRPAFSQEPAKPVPDPPVSKTHNVPPGPHSKSRTATDDWTGGGSTGESKTGKTFKDGWTGTGGGNGKTFKDGWTGAGGGTGKTGKTFKDGWTGTGGGGTGGNTFKDKWNGGGSGGKKGTAQDSWETSSKIAKHHPRQKSK